MGKLGHEGNRGLVQSCTVRPQCSRHWIILVQMKVLDGKCGYQATRSIVSPSSHLQTHTHLVFTAVWTLVPGQRKRLSGQSYPPPPTCKHTHTFSVYNCLNFRATGQWNRHLCATLFSRSLQLEMLTAQNSLHPEVFQWSSGRRLFFHQQMPVSGAFLQQLLSLQVTLLSGVLVL